MRTLLYLSLGFTIAVAAAGCTTKDTEGRDEAARTLYERSVGFTRQYIDSLMGARDSATVLKLSALLDSELTKINYSYPPDTHLEISEGENDTLSNLNERFVLLRDSLLYRFAHPLVLRQDSIAPVASDSMQMQTE